MTDAAPVYRVAADGEGRAVVVDAGGAVCAGPFETNAQAWRAVDRLGREPVSRAEYVFDHFANLNLKG